MNAFFIDMWLLFIFILLLRYFIISGLPFLLFYVIKKNKWQFKRIQHKFPQNKDYYREILYSITTFLIFSSIAVTLIFSPVSEFTMKYESINDMGIIYYFISIIIMIIIHDAYFYWTHRIMHHPKIFKYFHKVHHLSTNPSPWASFSFHPLEAIVEASIIIIIVFTIPFHFTAIMIFLTIMTLDNVMGHLGYEIFPKGMNKHFLGKWINTSVNHNMHHKFFKGNYCLYFTFWDKLMGTTHPDYHNTYKKVTFKRNKLTI